MGKEMVAGLVLALIGIFTTVAAAMDWEWFMNSYRAQFLNSLIGRPNARIFYIVFGVIFIISGICLMVGLMGLGGEP